MQSAPAMMNLSETEGPAPEPVTPCEHVTRGVSCGLPATTRFFHPDGYPLDLCDAHADSAPSPFVPMSPGKRSLAQQAERFAIIVAQLADEVQVDLLDFPDDDRIRRVAAHVRDLVQDAGVNKQIVRQTSERDVLRVVSQ